MLSQRMSNEPDQWRDAVLDALAACCVTVQDAASPAEIVRAVIDANVRIALDPAVSCDARMLVDRGRESIGTKALCHEIERALAEMSCCNYNSAAERLQRAIDIPEGKVSE